MRISPPRATCCSSRSAPIAWKVAGFSCFPGSAAIISQYRACRSWNFLVFCAIGGCCRRERERFDNEAPMRITCRTRLAGIMGWPVSHSRSPALHNFWLDEHGIDGAYVPLPVQPEQLERALRALPTLGFRGCNLTLPHKEAALAIVDKVDPLARRIGAVNTVIVMPDG